MNTPSEKSQKSTSKPLTSEPLALPHSPAYTPFLTTFATLSLHRGDRIRFFAFPQSDLDTFRAVIKSYWKKGISKEDVYGPAFEFKLNGLPWMDTSDDVLTSRVLMREILACLYKTGWILHACTDIVTDFYENDTLIFRKQQHPPPASEWISISLHEYDKLWLIGANMELISATKEVLTNFGSLQEDRTWQAEFFGVWEFRIKRKPWFAPAKETMNTRLLLLKILECLEGLGWSLYANVAHSMVGHDTWYCVKEKEWIEGMVVLH